MYGTKHSHRKLRKKLQLSLHGDSQSIIHLEKKIIHGSGITNGPHEGLVLFILLTIQKKKKKKNIDFVIKGVNCQAKMQQ